VEQLQAMADAGMHVPAIEQRPSLSGFEWLWEAFVELSSCRQTGMGVGAIPWTAVQRYVEVMRYTSEEAWLAHGVVRHLDDVFIKHHAEQQKQKQ
jgi:hypothetical protein